MQDIPKEEGKEDKTDVSNQSGSSVKCPPTERDKKTSNMKIVTERNDVLDDPISVSQKAKGTFPASSIDLKKQFLEEMGLGRFFDIDFGNDRTLNQLLEVRIEQQRKEIEELRDRNLNTLNIIIDKCIESDKLTDDSIRKILQLVDLPQGEQSISSPELKRRKLASPMMSPKGHRRYQSEIPTLTAKELQPYPPLQNTQSPYPVSYNNGPGPTPWLPQQYNTPLQPQYPFQASIPAGLGMATTRSREASSSIQNNENQMGTHHGSYSPAQIMTATNPPGNFPSNFFLPPGPGVRPPLMVVPAESPQRPGSSYLQPPQQVQPQYHMKAEPLTQRRFAGHRRSQSANVLPPNASSLNSARSPVRELQATPQKPVNFLIHTPKHPPPT